MMLINLLIALYCNTSTRTLYGEVERLPPSPTHDDRLSFLRGVRFILRACVCPPFWESFMYYLARRAAVRPTSTGTARLNGRAARY